MRFICNPKCKGGGSGQGYDFAGDIICNDGCDIGGKAFKFYTPQSNMPLTIKPGFDISITSANDSIELHKWNQEPNTGLSGRIFVGKVSSAGGTINTEIDSTHRWISVFARNPSNSDEYDGCCFRVDGNIITLLTF